ncbi:hypothetical protein M662_15975 [Bacillus sp. SB49]|uniref:hypothetical protein n=1 Tax=Bacillaceae TaxID=186817 RepID=UPI0004085A5C|nr:MULTISPECIES: hypothetical protein [Bacillaceae]QHT47916.1 hypothetical protein M662_15975 [Bacillus sp. SB49]
MKVAVVLLKIIGIPVYLYLVMLLLDQIFDFEAAEKPALLIPATLVTYLDVFFFRRKGRKQD